MAITSLHCSPTASYGLITDMVSDETNLEFCMVSENYLDNNLDVSMRTNGTSWFDIEPFIDEFEEKAEAKRAEKRGEA